MAGDKYLKNAAGTITEQAATQTSAGAGDAGKIPALDAAGRLASTMMPTGFGDDSVSVQASENLAAGDLINIHNVSGNSRARKADASTTGKEAHGFILAGVSSGNQATVFFEGQNTQSTGLTPGVLYLSTSPGLTTATAPSTAGQIVQRIGFATGATAYNFQSLDPIVLA